MSDFITILSLDPGHTTGYSVMRLPKSFYGKRQIKLDENMSEYLLEVGQFPYHENIDNLINKHNVCVVVFEEFKLYGHRANSKIGSKFETVQVVGIIKYLCHKYNIPWWCEGAAQAKKFYTDDKLKKHQVYFSKYKHARDSLRHMLYHIDFNAGKEKLMWYER